MKMKKHNEVNSCENATDTHTKNQSVQCDLANSNVNSASPALTTFPTVIYKRYVFHKQDFQVALIRS